MTGHYKTLWDTIFLNVSHKQALELQGFQLFMGH